MNPIHPDLAPLAQVAKTFSRIFRTTGKVNQPELAAALRAAVGEHAGWLRPEHRIGDAFLFGLPGNPVAVAVTFYQFVRDALLRLSGRTDDFTVPLLRVVAAEKIRKVPGRTEYQRGVLFQEKGEWKVRITGQQGSGVLRSMSEANCFIVLEHERGAVAAGEPVSVQLFEGLA